MALPQLASVDDLESWTGVSIDNMARADAILTAASTLVRAHTGRTSGPPPPANWTVTSTPTISRSQRRSS